MKRLLLYMLVMCEGRIFTEPEANKNWLTII